MAHGLMSSMLLALPLSAAAQTEVATFAEGKSQLLSSAALDSPAQAAARNLRIVGVNTRMAQLAGAEKVHDDLVVRLEEIRVYGRNEPEDFKGPQKSPLMQLRARLENDVPLSPAKKMQRVLCFIGLCANYGPEGIPLGGGPEERAEARLSQSTIELNAQFRGTLQ